MADEIISNALGGIVMLWIIMHYLLYLRYKQHRGHEVTKWERAAFRALCLISLVGIIVYYVRTQVL